MFSDQSKVFSGTKVVIATITAAQFPSIHSFNAESVENVNVNLNYSMNFVIDTSVQDHRGTASNCSLVNLPYRSITLIIAGILFV